MKHKIAFLMFLVLGFGLSTVAAQTETPPVKRISGGVLNGKATILPKPAYPAAAQAVGASGEVNVRVIIDEQGNVIEAEPISGHPLLRRAAGQSAVSAKFSPTLLSGQPVSVTGVLIYIFVSGANWSSEGEALGIAATRGVIRGKINLPEGFSVEQEQIDQIAKLPADEQKNQLPATVSQIKSKLNPTDLWRFEFSVAKGKIYGGNLEADETYFSSLAKFKELALNRAEGILEDEANRAAELAKFADHGKLTAEDRQAILSYLK